MRMLSSMETMEGCNRFPVRLLRAIVANPHAAVKLHASQNVDAKPFVIQVADAKWPVIRAAVIACAAEAVWALD